MSRRFRAYMKGLWGRFCTALVGMALVAALSSGMMWVMKYLVDHALTEKDMGALRTGALLIIITITLKSAFWYMHTYLTAYVAQEVSRRIRDTTYRHLYTLSMGFFNEKTSGGIMARLTNDVTTLQASLTSAPTSVIRDGLTIIGLVGFLFYTNWRFALLCFTILPVAAVFLTHLGRKSRRAGREGQEKMADMYAVIQEALTAMPIVKTFQREEKEIDDFAEENRRYFDTRMRLARVDARSSPIMEVIGAVILCFMLILGGRDVINGAWSLGSFIAFVGAAMSLYNPIKKFASVNVQIQQGIAAAERVFELLDQKGTVVEKPGAAVFPVLSRAIEFSKVGFSYPNSNPVLEDLNLTIRKGDIVALVGHSGAGKSTIAQLVLRFYDPTEGRVMLDGMDLRDGTIESLRRQIAIVTQETHLFNESVYANIAYGKPGATREEVIEAAKAAYAHDFISALPQGYDTVIGERGTRLSGGEKQRISIARALLKNPGILILDEATSALDAASEKAVQAALDHLLVGRTVFMIAHRLSTVRKATRIVVLERGRILESGSHEELIARGGAYRQLCEMQALG